MVAGPVMVQDVGILEVVVIVPSVEAGIQLVPEKVYPIRQE